MIYFLVFGSRSITDIDFISRVLHIIIGDRKDITIIEGDALGVDRIAGVIGKVLGLEVQIYKPNWNLYGKGAGFIRNEYMVKDCTKALGFWDGESHGTKNTIDLLKKYNKPHKIYIKKNGKWGIMN